MSRSPDRFSALAWVLCLALGLAAAGCNRGEGPSQQTTISAGKSEDPQTTDRDVTGDAGDAIQADPVAMQPLSTDEKFRSHQKMIAVLDRLAGEARKDNEYFNGRVKAQANRDSLQAAIESGNLVGQLEGHRAVGTFEMNVGNSAEAAEHLEQACALISKVEQGRLAFIPSESKEALYLKCAVAYLRLGEDENCVHCADGAACILPIAKDGIHRNRRGSEKAMEFFAKVSEVNPRNAIAVWLWNVAAMTLGEHPEALPEEYRISQSRFESQVDFPAFPNVAADVGLDTLSHAGGTIADDLNGDGRVDILVSNWAPDGQLKLFLNDGRGGFRDATEDANLIGITGGLNTVHGDYDNDGDLDVYVLRGAWLNPPEGNYPNSLLENDGNGLFHDVTFAVGLGQSNHPTQTAAWADYDLDGDLDLYVGNEKTQSQLYRNEGGRFVDVADGAGVLNRLGYAKAVAWGDYDGDRWPDLYVSNLGQDNQLFHNQRDGTFVNVAGQKDVAKPTDSFASWFWDYNNDGDLDLFVGSYTVGVQFVGMDYLGVGQVTEPDRLYQGDGMGFTDVGEQVGLTAVTQPMGCNYGDLDNDGFLDFYLGTGYPGYDGLMPNVMYHSDRGKRFEDVTFAGRFGHLQKGHGVAFVDLDDDGDQDVFTEMGGAYEGDAFHDALFENPGFENHWIKVKLIGTRSNRCAIGARIHVRITEDGKPRSIYRWVSSGSSFGGNPLRQEIGIGRAQSIDRLEVNWPATGQTQIFEDLRCDQIIEITEGETELGRVLMKAVQLNGN